MHSASLGRLSSDCDTHIDSHFDQMLRILYQLYQPLFLSREVFRNQSEASQYFQFVVESNHLKRNPQFKNDH